MYSAGLLIERKLQAAEADKIYIAIPSSLKTAQNSARAFFRAHFA